MAARQAGVVGPTVGQVHNRATAALLWARGAAHWGQGALEGASERPRLWGWEMVTTGGDGIGLPLAVRDQVQTVVFDANGFGRGRPDLEQLR